MVSKAFKLRNLGSNPGSDNRQRGLWFRALFFFLGGGGGGGAPYCGKCPYIGASRVNPTSPKP